MRRKIRFRSLLSLVLLFASVGLAQEAAVTPDGTTVGIALDGQDVITASDAGGGYLSTRDVILIVIIVLAVIGLAAVL